MVFIAVGTPSRRGDGFADLSYVYQAARSIARALTRFTVIVTKSTVPVGTGDEVERIIREIRPDADFAVVSNPEFLREGAAISDFKRPDRILIGTEDARAEAAMREVYRPLSLNQAPILVTSRRTAELTKYAANAFLAAKITFINEMADLCEEVGADVQQVARGIGLDNRIGTKFLHAGPGYGGSCFPKDTLALVKTAQDAGTPLRLVETVVAVNDQRKRAMARKVIRACGGSVRGKTVALLGLTFKPNTDDMRDAPAARHHRGPAGCWRDDPGLRSRGRGAGPCRSCRKSPLPTIPTRAPRAPTCWCLSPNGTRSGPSTWPGCAQPCAGGSPVLVDLRNIYVPRAPSATVSPIAASGVPKPSTVTERPLEGLRAGIRAGSSYAGSQRPSRRSLPEARP